jgi:hypothetical protein
MATGDISLCGFASPQAGQVVSDALASETRRSKRSSQALQWNSNIGTRLLCYLKPQPCRSDRPSAWSPPISMMPLSPP